MHDVVIVGAGVVGSALAEQLSRYRGFTVLLLDQAVPPAGASAVSGGLLRVYHPRPEVADLAAAGLDALASDPAFGYRAGGSLHLVGPAEAAAVSAAARRLSSPRFPVEVLDSTEVEQRVPALSPEPAGVAVWEPAAGWASPAGVTHTLVARARRAGVDCLFGIPLDGLLVAGGSCAGIVAGGAEYRARHTVIAAGAWTGRLLASCGLAPLDMRTKRIQYDIFAVDGAAGIPAFVDDIEDLYGRSYDSGHILAGTSVHEWDVDPADAPPRREITRRAADILRRRWPGLGPPVPVRAVSACDGYLPGGGLGHRVHPEVRGLSVLAGGAGGGFKIALPVTETVAHTLVNAIRPARSAGRIKERTP